MVFLRGGFRLFEENLKEELKEKLEEIEGKLNEIEEIQDMDVIEEPTEVLEKEEIKKIKNRLDDLVGE